MKKKFLWEKWVDPLQPKSFEEPDDQFDDEEFGSPEFSPGTSFKALPTPFGMFTVTNHSLASNKFDFWMLHTNFRITYAIATIMKNIDGVETINVLTRYRIRFGFPVSGLFSVSDVREEIESTTVNYFRRHQNSALNIFDSDTSQKAQEIRNYLDNRNEHWALYVLPNGNMEIIKENKTKVTDKFHQRVKFLNEVQELVGGAVMTSEDGE